MSDLNDDLLRRMMQGKGPTGFEHLTDRELLAASEGPPETPDGDSPEYAVGLLCEMMKRPVFQEATKAASRAASPGSTAP